MGCINLGGAVASLFLFPSVVASLLVLFVAIQHLLFVCLFVVVVVVHSSDIKNKEMKKSIRICVLMSIAYASNIGGTGSLIGSGPQLALKGILNE